MFLLQDALLAFREKLEEQLQLIEAAQQKRSGEPKHCVTDFQFRIDVSSYTGPVPVTNSTAICILYN